MAAFSIIATLTPFAVRGPMQVRWLLFPAIVIAIMIAWVYAVIAGRLRKRRRKR